MERNKGDFKPGNQLWKLRAKHGRNKLFATPELMMQAAQEYFQWADDNPWYKHEAIKSGEMAGTTMKVAIARPYTLHGLCIYLDCSSSYFRAFKSTLKPQDSDFLTVIEKIEEIIYNQKFEGASVGSFNANIIARDLGLTDKQEIENRGQIAINISSDEEGLGE